MEFGHPEGVRSRAPAKSQLRWFGLLIRMSPGLFAMNTDCKIVDCPLLVRGELLPQVKEFKYLEVLFMSDRSVRWTGGQ